MAFNRPTNSAQNNGNNNQQRTNTTGGYLNINIILKDGVTRKRLGGSGIALREEHPLEAALLDFCREAAGDPDKMRQLLSRIELTYAEATKPGEKFDLGL